MWLGLFMRAMPTAYKKKPVLSYELFFKDGGEAGIRTPDAAFDRILP